MSNQVMFEDAYFDEQGAWFSASTHNGLYYWDFEDDIVRFIGMFPDEEIFRTRLFCKVIYYEMRLIFIPFNASRIAEYDIQKKEFFQKELPGFEEDEIVAKFSDYVIDNNILYLFPGNWKQILIYNMKDRCFTINQEWNNTFQEYMPYDEDVTYFVHVKRYRNMIFAASYMHNIVFKFYLEDRRTEVFWVGAKDIGFTGIEVYNDMIILFSAKKNWLIKSDETLNEYDVVQYEESKDEEMIFVDSLQKDEIIYFIDIHKGRLYKFNILDNSINLVCQVKINKNKETKHFVLPYRIKEYNGNIFLCPLEGDGLIEVGENITIRRAKKIEKGSSFGKELQKYCKGMMFETNFCTLEDYRILLSEQEALKIKFKKGDCGEKLWSFID